ncbi:MAG: nitroreductase family protein, partial [Eubacterium sp.]
MFKKLVLENRSYRGYDESRKITREELLEMVDCARLTPASINMQPLKYYLAYTDECVAKIRPLTKWARALPELKLPHPGHGPTAFIIICQDTDLQPSITRFQKDIGIAAQT